MAKKGKIKKILGGVLKVGGIAAAVVGTGFLGYEGGSLITKAAKAFHDSKVLKAQQDGTDISDQYQDGSMNAGIGDTEKSNEYDDKQVPDATATSFHKGAAMNDIEGIVKKYWWVGAGFAAFFLLPRLMGGHSGGGYHRKKKR